MEPGDERAGGGGQARTPRSAPVAPDDGRRALGSVEAQTTMRDPTTETAASIERRSASRARDGGFTLIELMIVVVIIGILAAIAIPNFQHLIKRSKEASVRGNVHTIQLAIEAYAVDHAAVYPVQANDAQIQALLPGGAYPENPFTRAATVVPWNADPADPGEISITTLAGGGYMLRARGLLAMLQPDIVVGD
jgi:general secretion pathway protein G